jgi:hypothetical protein
MSETTEQVMRAILNADTERRTQALKVLEGGELDRLPEPLLTATQVCERLQISRATLWRWRLPCIRKGGVRRYRWPAVLDTLDKERANARPVARP